MGIYLQLLGEVRRSLTAEPVAAGSCPPGSARRPVARGRLQGLVTLTRGRWNPQDENLTTTVEVPSQRHGAVAEGLWSVFSSSLRSTQGLDFPVLPSAWKFPELKTCSLGLVQVNNLFQNEIWKHKMQYVKLGAACEAALQPRSCCDYLQTKQHPLCLASPIRLCLAVNSQNWGMGWGVQRTTGVVLSVSFPPPPPWCHFFTRNRVSVGMVSGLCAVTRVLEVSCVWVVRSFNALWN